MQYLPLLALAAGEEGLEEGVEQGGIAPEAGSDLAARAVERGTLCVSSLPTAFLPLGLGHRLRCSSDPFVSCFNPLN